nr:hypothetical protein [Lysinibacillus timonensis]
MTVSIGFYKRIHDWVLDEYTNKICFRPFQVNGNPYKSRVFVVGAQPEPLAKHESEDVKVYANSLVDENIFRLLNEEEMNQSSREYKGILNFVQYMKATNNEDVVVTSVNCYVEPDIRKLKSMKKLNDPLIVKGARIFKEVVNEFSPQIIILQGSKALKEFHELYEDKLIIKGDLTVPVSELENQGVIAELNLGSGKKCNVLACRSMSYFGKNGESFQEFKKIIGDLLNN